MLSLLRGSLAVKARSLPPHAPASVMCPLLKGAMLLAAAWGSAPGARTEDCNIPSISKSHNIRRGMDCWCCLARDGPLSSVLLAAPCLTRLGFNPGLGVDKEGRLPYLNFGLHKLYWESWLCHWQS